MMTFRVKREILLLKNHTFQVSKIKSKKNSNKIQLPRLISKDKRIANENKQVKHSKERNSLSERNFAQPLPAKQGAKNNSNTLNI